MRVYLDYGVNVGYRIKINQEIYPLVGYNFKHEVEREALLENMTPSQRRELHLKAAKTLEKRRHGIPRFSATLAQHYENLLQQPKALDAWLEAGRYARAQYLLEETHHAYGNALQLIKKFPRHFEEEKIMQVVNEWGSFAHDHDNTETGIYVADN